MEKYRIPFSRVSLMGNETAYMNEAVQDGPLSGNGKFTRRCEVLLEKELGVSRALLATSCTHALEMAALLLDLQPEDEVILPSFAFVSVANPFVLKGARPVFADIRPDTLNLDERLWESKITSKTKALVVLHYSGVACDMDPILKTAAERNVAVVEDNAHGPFGKYKGRFLGTLGTFGALSFHGTKNFTCGEGGALLLNDPTFLRRAEILREKGTDRERFFRGEVDKYTWVDVGSSYAPSEILAAFLLAQLEAKDMIFAQRRATWMNYREGLQDWARDNGVILPFLPSYSESSFHVFHLLMPCLEARQALIEHLKGKGILSVFHYQPLHTSEMGLKFGGKKGDCPISEEVSEKILRLPFFNGMTISDQSRVIEAIREFKA